MNGLSKIIGCALLVLSPLVANASVETVQIGGPLEATQIMIVAETIPLMIDENSVIIQELSIESDTLEPQFETLLATAKAENSARTSMRRTKLTDAECLALAMYHEARGEGHRGMLAVAHVIHNRVKSPAFPKDYCSVILQKSQFSFTSDKIPDNIRNWDVYQQVLRTSVELLHGGFNTTKSPVGGALYFHSLAKPYNWVYARGRKFIATLGNHHFFR